MPTHIDIRKIEPLTINEFLKFKVGANEICSKHDLPSPVRIFEDPLILSHLTFPRSHGESQRTTFIEFGTRALPEDQSDKLASEILEMTSRTLQVGQENIYLEVYTLSPRKAYFGQRPGSIAP